MSFLSRLSEINVMFQVVTSLFLTFFCGFKQKNKDTHVRLYQDLIFNVANYLRQETENCGHVHVAKLQERTADECGGRIRTANFKRQMSQHRKLVALPL
jgi:hypothetical protein